MSGHPTDHSLKSEIAQASPEPGDAPEIAQASPEPDDTIVQGRRVLLAVSGSIAVFKACLLARRLVSADIDLRVLMTDSATWFVQPLSFQFISHHPVYRNQFDGEDNHSVDHIQLAKWAELIVIAPISANRIARLALGLADDMLGALVLASPAPILMAPAMNQQMWRQAIVQQHLGNLRSRGWHLAEPGSGAQACGDTGPGRMAEVDALMPLIVQILSRPQNPADIPASQPRLEMGASAQTRRSQPASAPHPSGLRCLITMGATEEAIDPVRYISNRSSGRMGLSLFETLHACGVDVRAVSASAHADVLWRKDRLGLSERFTEVRSAEQMFSAVMELMESFKPDIFVGVAAVSDYRPRYPQKRKINSAQERIQIELERNPDIIASVKAKFPEVFCVAFAAQTHDLLQHGQDKLRRKGLDMVVVNSVGPAQGGADDHTDSLGSQYIRCIILRPGGHCDLGRLSKPAFSVRLVEEILDQIRSRPLANRLARGS